MAKYSEEVRLAIDGFLDQFAQGKLENMKSNQDSRTALLDSLLTMEINQLSEDRKFLKEQGLSLDDVDITGDFNKIIALTGNAEIHTTLNLLLNDAKQKSKVVDATYAQFIQGRNTAQEAERLGYTSSPGETGEDRFLLSEAEKERYFTEQGITIPGGSTGEAFDAGFTQGSTTMDEALARLTIENQAHTTSLALAEGRLGFAEKNNAALANTVGGSIIANIMSISNIPIIMYKGALGGDAAMRLTFSDALQSFDSQKNFIPNIKHEFITALQLYADPTDPVKSHMGFVRMSGKAYGYMVENSTLEQNLVNQGYATDSGMASVLLSDTNSDHFSNKYIHNMELLREYASIGVMPTDISLAEKAYVTMQQYDAVQMGYMNAAKMNSEQLAEMTGYAYDEIDESLVKLEQNDFESRMVKWEEVESSFNEFFPEGIEALDSEDITNLDIQLPENLQDIYTEREKLKGIRQDYHGLIHGSDGRSVDGEVINNHVYKTMTDKAGNQQYVKKDGEYVIDYSNASFKVLSSELRKIHFLGAGGDVGFYIDSLINENPDVRHTSYHADLNQYIPNPDELDKIRVRVQETIANWLNPESAAGFAQAPFANLFGSAPFTGLLVHGLGGGIRDQGIDAAASHIDDAVLVQKLWRAYVDRWNQLRTKQGLGKVAYGDLEISLTK